MIIEYTLIMGIITGTISILGVVFNYVYHKHFSLGGVVLVVFGTLLLGLSLWQSIELSIKSDGSVSAKYKQDLGAKTAEKNRRFKELEIQVATLIEDMKAIKNTMPIAISNKVKYKRKSTKDIFDKNSQYYVLVFHKLTQIEHANTLTNLLLDEGYNSSATSAELTTFSKQLDENMAMVIYTERGKNILPQIKRLLTKTNMNVKFVFESNSRAMRQGDIQILLF